jgi:hypothetical protein
MPSTIVEGIFYLSKKYFLVVINFFEALATNLN